jgi:hypothetical protein
MNICSGYSLQSLCRCFGILAPASLWAFRFYLPAGKGRSRRSSLANLFSTFILQYTYPK